MKLSKQRRRFDNEVNAGSMADIAFLLLIFFLVTTTIVVDAGISVKLPPWTNDPLPPISSKNVLSVKINAANELLVEGERAEVLSLKDTAKEFIMNPDKRDDLPSKPNRAVIAIQNDRGTSYETYLGVYNELKAVYNELWENEAQTQFNKPYDKLSKENQRTIRNYIPLVISESEPTDYIETN